MKKNLLLTCVLVLVLGITFLLTETDIVRPRPQVEIQLQEALKVIRKIQLPQASFEQTAGVWRSSAGDIVKAELLDELHKSLEQFQVVRTLEGVDVPVDNFFAEALRVKLNGEEFLIGEMTPAQDGFYFGRTGDRHVYVVDLNAMGSLAVADDNHQLQLAKFQRLRDLLMLPEDRWRENRLVALTALGSFTEWKAGDIILRARQWGDYPWGDTLVQRVQAGLASLVLKGTILRKKPMGKIFETWQFTQGKKTISWEIYSHPVHHIYLIWDESEGKAYPLDEPSSALLKEFPRTLVNAPLRLDLATSNWREATVDQRAKTWKANREGSEWRVDPPNPKVQSLLQFMEQSQNFEQVKLLTPQECQTLALGSTFGVTVGEAHWRWLTVPQGRVLLECRAGIALSWRLPLESAIDFATLEE